MSYDTAGNYLGGKTDECPPTVLSHVPSFNLPAGAPDMEELRLFRASQRMKRRCNDVRYKLVSRVRRARRFQLPVRPHHTLP